jgi:hypothetical protein
MERETGLEPEVIRFACRYIALSGLFPMQLVLDVLPCFSVYRRLVITRLSQPPLESAFFTLNSGGAKLAPCRIW